MHAVALAFARGIPYRLRMPDRQEPSHRDLSPWLRLLTMDGSASVTNGLKKSSNSGVFTERGTIASAV